MDGKILNADSFSNTNLLFWEANPLTHAPNISKNCDFNYYKYTCNHKKDQILFVFKFNINITIQLTIYISQ